MITTTFERRQTQAFFHQFYGFNLYHRSLGRHSEPDVNLGAQEAPALRCYLRAKIQHTDGTVETHSWGDYNEQDARALARHYLDCLGARAEWVVELAIIGYVPTQLLSQRKARILDTYRPAAYAPAQAPPLAPTGTDNYHC
jgi:hypothetical protein